jgi:threonine synthase
MAKIPEGSRVVCTVTGHGLKDPDVFAERVAQLKPVPPNMNDVLASIAL